MEETIRFTVNGRPRTVTTDPDRPLLDVLREDLHLTGAKFGCGEGRCRACTVLVGTRGVASCLTPVAEVEGKAIRTVEGLSSGDGLHPVQEAFLAESAFQCGFCTPGMVLAVVGLLEETPDPTDEQILARLDRHICRCCGYPRILAAVHRARVRGGR